MLNQNEIKIIKIMRSGITPNNLDEINHIIAQSFAVSPASLTNAQTMKYVSNMYMKLCEAGLINTRNKSGVVDILNDIALFNMTSVNDIICYILGKFRAVDPDKYLCE